MTTNMSDDDDDDDDDDEDFWRELASDIANGLNNESELDEEGSVESSSSLEFLGAHNPPKPGTKPKPKPKKKKCNDETSHYHCYCLRSLDPRHPFKNYVGFTTDPGRRLRQHNGILKHGGAWKTRRGGRPWEFVVVVAGFPTHTMALQFEWAWQHPHKSLLVRAVLGDENAKKVRRKRGTPGQLCILKTLLERCPKLYDWNALELYFFKKDCMALYEKAIAVPALPPPIVAANLAALEGGKRGKVAKGAQQQGSGLGEPRTSKDPSGGGAPVPPPAVSTKLIASLEKMPFSAARNRGTSRGRGSTAAGGGGCDNRTQGSEADRGGTPFGGNRDGHKDQTAGLGDLYRRCCDFGLSDETSSSEDDETIRNGDRRRLRRRRRERAVTPCPAPCAVPPTSIANNSQETESDEDVLLLADSMREIGMKPKGSGEKWDDILSFSSSSSSSSSSRDFAVQRISTVPTAHGKADRTKPNRRTLVSGTPSFSGTEESDGVVERKTCALPLENITNRGSNGSTLKNSIPISAGQRENKAFASDDQDSANADDGADSWTIFTDDDSSGVGPSGKEVASRCGRDGDRGVLPSLALESPTLSSPISGRPIKTKRLSIVDLCTP